MNHGPDGTPVPVATTSTHPISGRGALSTDPPNAWARADVVDAVDRSQRDDEIEQGRVRELHEGGRRSLPHHLHNAQLVAPLDKVLADQPGRPVEFVLDHEGGPGHRRHRMET